MTSPQSFVDSLDKAIAVINSELQKIRRDFSKVIEEHDKAIEALRAENTSLKTRCESLEARIASLENSQVSQAELINKRERFSRRNNFRIVGLKTESDEDSIQKAMEVIAKVGVNNCKIERDHRDGRSVPGRDRHLLVKLSYYQDKVTIMKNARQALASENYYIIDDLTKLDLKEKRRWSQQVNQLFEQGTRLRFSGGCWRSINAGDFNFVFNLELDKTGGNPRTNFKARETCLDLMATYDLIDIWREKNPCVKNFTWSSNVTPGIHCRLDYFLVSRYVSHAVNETIFSPGNQSDHSCISLTIRLILSKEVPAIGN
ncbi:hypothetical protein HOLleu_43552 [Holothuria leucospilota]|uniref:Uncharacterized protein n=1 Tax=Holothuria leucospilota TaxID=206669 RepID=A0A9Q0YGU5_HOLLE|nr:hypothetical protein HOLleu_43552 [Holothuria leucospilota]